MNTNERNRVQIQIHSYLVPNTTLYYFWKYIRTSFIATRLIVLPVRKLFCEFPGTLSSGIKPNATNTIEYIHNCTLLLILLILFILKKYKEHHCLSVT